MQKNICLSKKYRKDDFYHIKPIPSPGRGGIPIHPLVFNYLPCLPFLLHLLHSHKLRQPGAIISFQYINTQSRLYNKVALQCCLLSMNR